MLKWVLAAGLALAMPAVASAQDVEAGKKVFNKCAPCHAIGPGAKNKVGPELNGILNRAAASVAGFAYSDALKKSGLTWDDANLHKWLENPKALQQILQQSIADVESKLSSHCASHIYQMLIRNRNCLV